MDFTLSTYQQLLKSLIENNYSFLTVEEYFTRPVAPSPLRPLVSSQSRLHASSLPRPIVIMRHDVDRKPANSLRMAKLEAELGVKATYYFRTIAQTLKPQIIKQIAELGHEIGYHYENLAIANSRMKNENPVKYSRSSNFTGQECNPPSSQSPGLRRTRMKNVKEYQGRLYDIALEDFEENLAKLREIVPIKNIAMHGRPTSKLDSRDLWKQYNYKDYGITSEPYFDLDFSQVQYITDAGRSWDNATINLRDKVDSPFENNFKQTNDIIQAAASNQLSQQIMFNIHPEHWAATSPEWLKIWTVRKVKNAVKKVVLRKR